MNRLTRIAMVDSQTGWAVGRGGVVLRTIDGGAHWIQQTSGTGLDLLGLAVVDAQNAWAVGANGTVVTTSNGGANWATRQRHHQLAVGRYGQRRPDRLGRR
ncbi:MAG: hypothetical protein HZY76_03880 [Anaerolineae bacterium]|nr:MAG: hypothetical protein HZY76_03880 [Anaerolineae bacterium]